MNEENILRLLAQVDAILTDTHVVYTSGRHGATYVNKDAIYLHPTVTTQLCRTIARQYDATKIDVVAGPTTGGVILAQWTAWHMTAARDEGETLAVFAEEEGEGDANRRIFRRGYDASVQGKRVVVVEDILTTGGSARKVVEAVRALGGTVVGLSAICNRGGVTSEQVGGVPLTALVNLDLTSYAAEDCPLCRAGVRINTRVGKGQAFVDAQGGQA